MSLTICVAMPQQPAAIGDFQKLVRLLRREPGSVQVILADLQEGRASKPATRGRKASPGHAGGKIKKVVADLHVCWGGQALGKVLRQQPASPIVYGVTLDDVRQGAVPSHPRIVGYLCDGGFPRTVLTGAGIPLAKQFGLAAWLGAGDARSARREFGDFRRNILLVSDDPGLIAAVKGACELLWLRLERLSLGAAAQDIPAGFYERYDCVIGSGWAALDAAAAGVAVIVADGRGTAGRLTPTNLQRVLDANAGPGCFDGPVGAEMILAALSDATSSSSGGLGEALRQAHSASARLRQLLGWLRQLTLEAGSFAAPGDAADGPRRLDISPALPAAIHWERSDAADWSGSDTGAPSRPPVPEVLVDAVEQQPAPATLPSLSLGRRFRVGSDSELTGLFGEGWHEGEAWGRWSGSREAALLFSTPVDEAGDLELLFSLHAFLSPIRTFQRVIVSVNGHWLVCWPVDRQAKQAPFRLPLPAELSSGDGVWRIRLFLPDTDTPRAWGLSDCRQLGVGLSGLELRRAETPPKLPPAPRLPLGRRIPASATATLAGLFGEGWHRGESWGRWSASQAPVLRFRTEAGEGDLELLLHLFAFLPPGRLFHRVAVSVNGHPWVCWRIDRDARLKFNRGEWDAPFRLTLPSELQSHDGVWRVRFALPDAESPSHWGQKDGRQLGLGIAGLELRRPAAVPLPPPPPRLPLGRYIHASDADALAGFFRDGWSRQESWGRWTEQDEAAIRFETETVDDDLELLFHINTFLPPIRQFQRVIVVVNGHPRLCWKVDRHVKEAPFCLPLPKEWRGDNGLWRIVLRFPDADSPRAWGFGDSRKLGLGLSGLELRYTRPSKNHVSYVKPANDI